MSVIDLRRRLDRIEAGRGTGAPTRILADRPPGEDDDEAAAALADWRTMVAQGRASLSGDTLCLIAPEMTEAEWTARHVTER